MKFYLALSLYIQVVKKKKKLVKVLVFKFFGQRFIWNLHFRISSKDLNRPKSGGNYGVPAKRDAIFVHWTLVRTPSCLYWKSASHHYLNYCIPFLKKKKKPKTHTQSGYVNISIIISIIIESWVNMRFYTKRYY